MEANKRNDERTFDDEVHDARPGVVEEAEERGEAAARAVRRRARVERA